MYTLLPTDRMCGFKDCRRQIGNKYKINADKTLS